MAFDLSDLQFRGAAFPEPFVKFELEKELSKHGLLPKSTGKEGKELSERWDIYRRKLRALNPLGGSVHVQGHVIEPILSDLGYDRIEQTEPIHTTEEPKNGESGGVLLVSENGESKLRVWTAAYDEDLYAPTKRGRAFRYSHLRIAQRVLKATGERLAILTNGVELILLISEPARVDSTITFQIDTGWKRTREVPDSFRFLLALCSPKGVESLADLIDKARLQQTKVTKELRIQARQAVERFIQEVIDHPDNQQWYESQEDKSKLAKELWHEGLVVIYRLLFILKLESSDDPARVFSFASNSLWRNTFSPSMALAIHCAEVLHDGAETGTMLESGLRTLFRMFERGVTSTELNIKPLGGALFGENTTPHLSGLTWGERAVAHILDRLLWTPKRRGAETRERVHYGSLDVEDLGRVYEALLELDAGITTEPMCRLRRQKLEVVVPVEQGEKYKPEELKDTDEESDSDEDDADEEEDEAPKKGKKTKVDWIEEIPVNQFYLRVGLGRKATGSYYTPHSFVKFLVQETIDPLVDECSPKDDPNPVEILRLKVVDIAMGSGHFLAEACRYMGDKLYEACRLCDEKALEAERTAEETKKKDERESALSEVHKWRQRIIDLPDPDDEMLLYLPSRSVEGEESRLSQRRAEALSRRLVATHCLYGVDKNPLAVELAKLVLWIEAHAEGMPLTFLDHRLVVGDSLTGASWNNLFFLPSDPSKPLDSLFTEGLHRNFTETLREAIRYVGELDASVGTTVADMENKRRIKEEIDRSLLPFRVACAAWSGGVMLGRDGCDDAAYEQILMTIASTGDLPESIDSPNLIGMISSGMGLKGFNIRSVDCISRNELISAVGSVDANPAIPYEMMFPEVFFPNGEPFGRRGFHCVLGNPPWDAIRKNEDHFFGMYDFAFLDPPTKREKTAIKNRLLRQVSIREAYETMVEELQQRDRINDSQFETHKVKVKGQLAGRGTYDDYMLFAEQASKVLDASGYVGYVLPSAFHANEGSTGTRQLYLQSLGLKCCYSFENRRKLFEIDSRFKFAIVIASKKYLGKEFECRFYLHDDEWLFEDRQENERLLYTSKFIQITGGDYLSLLELKSRRDYEIAEQCYLHGKSFGEVVSDLGIKLSQEVNMTYDSERFTPIAEVLLNNEDPREPTVAKQMLDNGYLTLHEGKTFWHYDDMWADRPRYVVALNHIRDKNSWIYASQYYRLAFRDIASSTNERTVIFCLLPARCIVGNTAPTERKFVRTNAEALHLLGIVNTFCFDWLIRIKATTHVNLFVLNGGVLPRNPVGHSFVAHSALRLSSNHSGYERLWSDQIKDAWRESDPRMTFPVLKTDREKWDIRSALDAVVAYAYGLGRDQYEQVLSSFSHTSYLNAPKLCLSRYDELESIGLDAFTKKYDPYWDIPLNEELPKPVIEIAGVGDEEDGDELVMSHEPPKKKGRRRK